MNRICRSFALVLALAAAAPAGATVYLVRPDGTGDFPTIQAAVDACFDGDVIELTDGTFRGTGNRDIEYRGKLITVRSQGGRPERCILDCEHSGRGFRFVYGETPAARVEGITVRNGTASTGGAVNCSGASPSFVNCVFAGNAASYGAAFYS